MKKFLFLPLMAAAALFVACNDDEATPAPAAATITGSDANVCPSLEVTLTAVAEHATSFQWKKDNTVISGASAATLKVTATGAYSVAGVNETGSGDFSAAKNVTITECIPASAMIVGDNANVCPETAVTLTASADRADSYAWKKDGADIPGQTSATLVVTETGSYTVAAVNNHGTGDFSAAKVVTITGCIPAVAEISGADANVCPVKTVTLTASADRAESYVWKKDGVVIDNETTATLVVTATGEYTVAGVNTHGTGEFSTAKNVTIEAFCFPSGLLGNYSAAGEIVQDAGTADAWDFELLQDGDETTYYVMSNFDKLYEGNTDYGTVGSITNPVIDIDVTNQKLYIRKQQVGNMMGANAAMFGPIHIEDDGLTFTMLDEVELTLDPETHQIICPAQAELNGEMVDIAIGVFAAANFGGATTYYFPGTSFIKNLVFTPKSE